MQHSQASPPPLDLSLIAPICNEEGNLRALVARVIEVFGTSESWELLLVDDGSTDKSRDLILELQGEDSRVRGIFFSRNCGQTAAIAAGIQQARGTLVATLDGDLQNDPQDLPNMILALRSDPDLGGVVGWRQKRNDNFVRRVSSRVANAIRNRLSGDSIRDTGCSLKVFRQEAIRSITLFEGMHRFLPTLVRYHGYRILEHPVSHHARVAGTSKYGIRNRAWRSFKDLLAVRWMRSRLIELPIVLIPSVGSTAVQNDAKLAIPGVGAQPAPHAKADPTLQSK